MVPCSESTTIELRTPSRSSKISPWIDFFGVDSESVILSIYEAIGQNIQGES